MLLYDLTHFASSPVATPYGVGLVTVFWLPVVAAGVAIAIHAGKSRLGWLAAGAAALAASPIVYLHYFSLLSVGLAQSSSARVNK
jgi:hypothetical protein